MGRFSQTIARVAAGFACLGSLAWLFWPSDFSFLKNPEALFVFATAIAVWIATELKYSEEVNLRQSSPNDVRVGKEVLALHGGVLRDILKDHDTFQFANSTYYQILDELSDRRSRQKMLFQDLTLDRLLNKFEVDAKTFHRFVAVNTTTKFVAGREMIGFKPMEIVKQDEYDALLSQSRQANALGSKAWDSLDQLASAIRKRVPEALDDLD